MGRAPFSRASIATLAAIAISIPAAAPGQATGESPPAAERTVWDGVYSVTQAVRGQEFYTVHCASCHGDDLTEYGGLLRGQRFMDKYREASVHLLFDKTRTTMPRNAAGTLSDQTYVDIVGYILKANEFPAGDNELRVDDLANVRLVGKGGAEPVPDFSLVLVVGCLGRRDDAWILTNTTDPVRTGHPQPAADELAARKATSLGMGTFRLLVSPAYSPGAHIGSIVEVRGFLIRRPNDNRINLTSIEPVGASTLLGTGPACGP